MTQRLQSTNNTTHSKLPIDGHGLVAQCDETKEITCRKQLFGFHRLNKADKITKKKQFPGDDSFVMTQWTLAKFYR